MMGQEERELLYIIIICPLHFLSLCLDVNIRRIRLGGIG